MTSKYLQIGRVRKEISMHHDITLVPKFTEALIQEYFPRPNTVAGQQVLQHVQWLMQKDILGQDMFLLGSPGPFRRRLVKYYCFLAKRELESLVITADTSESDLKERREILGGTVYYTDQAPLKAAVHGRLLLIEDVHKAERNVLPTLNNLLENREMNLPSGRRLVHYKSAAAEQSGNPPQHPPPSKASSGTVVVCSQGFRVAALGSPVPLFPGYTLDPPFRSRFQGRLVEDPVSELHALDQLLALGVKLPEELLAEAAELVQSLPWPPKALNLSASNVGEVVVETQNEDGEPSHAALSSGMCFAPHTALHNIAQKLSNCATTKDISAAVLSSFPVSSLMPQQLTQLSSHLRRAVERHPPAELSVGAAMETLTRSVAAKRHVCLVGPRGCGKTTAVVSVLTAQSAPFTVFHCFKDMTFGDLLERRVLDKQGNSSWQAGPIVDAARRGCCAVIDGLHRAPPGIMGALSGLMQDGHLALPSGGVLELPESTGFFVIGVAEGSSVDFPWMNTETATLFHDFIELAPPLITSVLHEHGLQTVIPDPAAQARLLTMVTAVSEHVALSPRTLRLLMQRLTAAPTSCRDDVWFIRDLLARTLMLAFLPATVRQPINAALDVFVGDATPTVKNVAVEVDTERRVVTIGGVAVAQGAADTVDASLVPYAPNFVVIPSQARILHGIAEELVAPQQQLSSSPSSTRRRLQQHFLLIGNQGTGKNKLCDALLHLMWREREYMQLNRDTTVQSLTMTPSVEGGSMKWELSPLLEGIRSGRCVVVDEADKAPLEAVCVLKALLWDQFLSLPDGRVVRQKTSKEEADGVQSVEGVIFIHPDFRCFVLANRPGFPFLGNDFFRECGDIFSTFVVENPDLASELQLVRAYAPNVSTHILSQLCVSFEKLRALVDKGELQYPFSTREIVNISKHLNEFPAEPLAAALRNVIDFDGFSPHVLQIVKSQLEESGIVLEHHGRVQITENETLSDGARTSPVNGATATLTVLGDPAAMTSLVQDQDKTLRLPVRDVSNEVAHDLRPVQLKKFSNPRSYQFTRLSYEMQLQPFAVASDGGSPPNPGRTIEQALALSTIDTSKEYLLLLAASPRALFIVPAAPLIGNSDGQLDIGVESTGNTSTTTAPLVAEGSTFATPREIDVSFIPGAIHHIFPATNNLAAIVSLESASLWLMGIGEGSGANRLYRIAIPAVFYTGASPTSSGNEEVNKMVSDIVGGRTHQPQKLGHRFLEPESYIRVVSNTSDERAALVLVNDTLGIGLALRWTITGPIRDDPIVVDATFFKTSEGKGAELHATSGPLASLQCLSITSVSAHAGRPSSGLVATHLPSHTAPLSSVVANEMPTPPAKAKSVAELIRKSRESANSQPKSTTAQVEAIIAPRIKRCASKCPATIARTGNTLIWLLTGQGSGSTVQVAVASLDDASSGTTLSPAMIVELPIPSANPPATSMNSAAILSVSSSPCNIGGNTLVDVVLSVLIEASVAKEEIWKASFECTKMGGATTVLQGSIRRVRLDRDANQLPLTSKRASDHGSIRIHSAVYGCQPWVTSASRRPLLVVSSDGTLESWDVEAQDTEAARQAWDAQVGDAEASQKRGLAVDIITDADIHNAQAGALDDGDFGFQRPPQQPSDTEPQAPAEGGPVSGEGSASGSGSSGSGGSGGSGGGGGGGGGSGSGNNLVGDGRGGFTTGADGKLSASSGRRRQTQAKVVLTQSTGSGLYDRCLAKVQTEVAHVTAILEAAEVKEKERVWQSNRLVGELDDRKLVDAVIGEANVYKRRGTPSTPLGLPQRKPKYIDVLVDVSASMARFNAWDQRLDRLCEAVVMMLESAKRLPHKFVMDVHGHSGSSARTPFLRCSKESADVSDAPTNSFVPAFNLHASQLKSVPASLQALKDRVKVVESMAAHARGTSSGDGTVDAIRLAIEHCQKISHEVDESFIILVSDANLGGYGVTPKELADVVSKSRDGGAESGKSPISVTLLFISEKEAADWMTKELPVGVGRHCQATKDMPQILRDIFLNALASP